jgi:alkylation response protein AidB-like acyl-CoA dehydrogenase
MTLSVLSDSDRQLVMEVRELASTHIAERGAQLDLIGDREPDWVIPKLLAERNLLAPTIPENYGGRGLSMMATVAIVEELAAGCAGAAAIVVANNYALTPILVAGRKHLQDKFLSLVTQKEPHLASPVINDVVSEFDVEGTGPIPEDITRISTTIRLQGDQVIINGTKDYILNGAMADFMVLLARNSDSRHKSRLQFVVIPADTPGIHITEPVLKIGMRSAHTVRLHYDNVTVPEDYRIGRTGGGYFLLLQTFDRNLALVGAIGVGIARSAYECVHDLARRQNILGKNTSDNYHYATALADMSAHINAARLSVYRAAYQIDQEGNYSRVSTMAKLYATQVAQQVSSRAVDLVGRMGFLIGHPLEKYLRDAQMLSMIAGSDYLHRKTVADQL